MTHINEQGNQITCDKCGERYDLPENTKATKEMRELAIKVFMERHGDRGCFRRN